MKNFYYHKSNGIFWFRIFGFGLHFKDIRLGLMFSQRYGYSKYFRLGKWVITILKPFKNV